uniref:Uncharacterized protein n=1 Tax=Anguilla anguilla TaxID=7936 RepID=A0A0E9Q0S0_ANGAN
MNWSSTLSLLYLIFVCNLPRLYL